MKNYNYSNWNTTLTSSKNMFRIIILPCYNNIKYQLYNYGQIIYNYFVIILLVSYIFNIKKNATGMIILLYEFCINKEKENIRYNVQKHYLKSYIKENIFCINKEKLYIPISLIIYNYNKYLIYLCIILYILIQNIKIYNKLQNINITYLSICYLITFLTVNS